MLDSMLNDYGYQVLLLGSFLESETVLVLGGVAAHLGYLSRLWITTSGFVGVVGLLFGAPTCTGVENPGAESLRTIFFA